MIIGIPKESLRGENRVAITPTGVEKLVAKGFEVNVQKNAGSKASFSDEEYKDAGANLVTKKKAWQSDVVVKINSPTIEESTELNEGAHLISILSPAQQPELLSALNENNVTALAMDMVPRMTRSQSMDVLSSMANIAGYRAVIEATHKFGRVLTGQITAAGNMPPAKVMIIGAGVAGLAAIGTATSLGAIVRAFDTRPEVKEQIESMGAEFLELDFEEESDSSDGYAKEMSQAFIDAEMALFMEQAKEVDIIITTAMIPGKPAPKLITKEMVEAMKNGSVIVDLAAAGGGNCEVTEAGKVIVHQGVNVIGYTDLVSRLPNQSSQLYSNNVVNLITLLNKGDDDINIDFEDQVVRNMTVTHQGEVTFPPPPIQVSQAAPKPKEPEQMAKSEVATEEQTESNTKYWFIGAGIGAYAWIASVAPPSFLQHFTVFVLACVVGYYVIWNVSHSLHTPLMSVTNAISGIIIVGALLQVGSGSLLVQLLSAFAILIATINIVGGFYVTKRMLKMFKK